MLIFWLPAVAADYVAAPRDRLYYANSTFARYNPLGLVNQLKVGWRRRLSTKDSLLFRDTYAFLGANVVITPANARLGVYGEAQLLSVLRVFGEFNGTSYFGTFDNVQSFVDPAVRYSDRTLDANGDAAEATVGWVATIGGTVRMKVGPIVVRTTPSVTQFRLALGEGQYFYEPVLDRLAPNGGWMVNNDLDVLYFKKQLRAGVRYSFSDGLDGSRDSTDGSLSHHRVGPLFAWELNDKAIGARINHPTLFVLAQWWMQHPYRAGAEQSQALPLIAAGFAFNGDLLKVR